MGDVAQILSVGEDSKGEAAPLPPPPPPPPPPSHHPSRAMKMTGVSREVMDLLSGNQDTKSAALPPIMPTIPPAMDTTVKVGNKYISASKSAKPWVWAPFASSARTDGALFHHWVRANVEYPDYPYARFDIHLDPITYTDEEYTSYLQNDEWTRSETDKLMELARVYELRWAVIHDRWSGSTPRPVEDLQHRYYSVAATLFQQRVQREASIQVASLASNAPVVDSEETKAIADQHLMETAAARALATAKPQHQPLMAAIGTGSSNKNVFDIAKERERRAQMELIWHRTKGEELEEVQLRKELRLIDAQIRKLKKSGGHILAARGMQSSAPSSRNPSRSVSPVTTATTMDVGLLDQCFASTAPTPVPGTPYLQSGRLAPPATGGPVGLNKTTLKRMETVLTEELRIPSRPLPTKRVCDLYDNVRKDALTLLTLQKMVIQKEAQLQNKRLRLAKMSGGSRVIDEEALLGIATPPAPAPAPPAATGRSKTSSKSKSKTSKSKSKGEPKSDAAAAAAAATPGGKTAPGKGARKTATKRKKKASEKAADSSGTAKAGEPKSGDDSDAKQPSKKRARKS